MPKETTPQTLEEVQKELEYLTSPAAELLPDYERLNKMIVLVQKIPFGHCSFCSDKGVIEMVEEAEKRTIRQAIEIVEKEVEIIKGVYDHNMEERVHRIQTCHDIKTQLKHLLKE